MVIATVYKGLSNKPRTVFLPAGKRLRDALPLEDLDHAAIFVNNRAEDGGYVLKEGDNVFVRLMPGTATAIAIGIVVAILLAGVVCGVAAYIEKKMTEELSAELEKLKSSTNSDIDNRPFLRGASNTEATSKTQPYICGRHLFTPYLLASTWHELSGTDGDTQHANIILEGGFNRQVIHTVGTDDVDILTLDGNEPQEGAFSCNTGTVFADGTVEIAQDGELLTALPELNYKHVSTTANEEVPKISDINSGDAEDYVFTLDSHARDVEVCITFNSGLYAYDDDGNKTSTSVTVTPQYSLDGGSTWNTFYFDNNGTATNTFSRQISSKELRFAAKKEFSLSDYETLYANGQSVIQCRIRSNGNTDSQICNTCYVLYYQSLCFDPNTSSSPAGALDDGGEAGLSKCLVLNDRERAKSVMIGLRLKATSSNEDKLSKIFVISSGIARTWDGEKWSEEKTPTRNPAAWALEILTSDTHALSRYSDEEIDLESFGDFYEFCEENDFYFDYVVSQKMKKETVLGYITDSCCAALYTDIYGRKAIAIDRPQENAVAVYNPQNVISCENEREFARRTDCVRITYVNSEDDLYEEDTCTLMREVDGEALELTEDTVITDISTSGITTYEHAAKYARRLMAIEALRPKSTTIEVGNEGIFLTPYSKVLIQDDSLKIGTGHSIVKGVNWFQDEAQWLVLESPVTIEAGKSYGVIVNCWTDDGPRPLALKVAGEIGEVTELEILSELTVASEVAPTGGEAVSFGELDDDGEFTRITTPYMVAGITRSDNGFSLELVNYDEAIYDSGTIPDYRSNITQKPSSGAAAIEERGLSLDDVWTAAKGAMQGIITGGSDVGNPDVPQDVAATAEQDGIRLTCSLKGLGLRNNIKEVTWEITRGDGSAEEVSAQSAEGCLYFDRESDGYPEAEELMMWTARAKCSNMNGGESEWSASVVVNVDSYGTWLASAPSLTATVSGRTITLSILQPALASGRTRYGTFYNNIQIQKPSESEAWLKPATTLDPYASEDNWNEGEGYVTAQTSYTQTMPLTGQTLVETEVEGETVWQSSPEATLYRFRVVAWNEARESEASEINATALGTGIQDIVQGSVTHDKISTPSLSAIAANMGYITSGAFAGSELNYWALSSLLGLQSQGIPERYEGAFRVGGQDEYLLVEPQATNSVVTGYKVYFKAGVFEVTAESSAINGELTVQAAEDSLDRTRITPTGTYWEHRETVNSEWRVIVQVTQSGIIASSLISLDNLVISNMGLAERRALGHDIGRPYLSEQARVWHFDTDWLDQNQQEGLVIEGVAALETRLDPAILAVAPYAENVAVAYGQFSAYLEIGSSARLTCDFWLYYEWNENQSLFDIGSDQDTARLAVKNAECYWNDYYAELDAAPFNQEQVEEGDVTVWNEPAEASAYVEHRSGGSYVERVELSEVGEELAAGEWMHCAVVMSEDTLSVFLGKSRRDFSRRVSGEADLTATFNVLRGTFCLDELYADAGAEESFDDFCANTDARIPWGALDYGERHFVLDADCLHTNIFDSDGFRSAVKEIIGEEEDGDD